MRRQAGVPVLPEEGPQTMTFRERLLAVFDGRRPDRLPWFADLLYWRGAHMAMGDIPERYATHEGFGQLHRDYGAGM